MTDQASAEELALELAEYSQQVRDHTPSLKEHPGSDLMDSAADMLREQAERIRELEAERQRISRDSFAHGALAQHDQPRRITPAQFDQARDRYREYVEEREGTVDD